MLMFHLAVLRWPCAVDRTLKSNYYYFPPGQNLNWKAQEIPFAIAFIVCLGIHFLFADYSPIKISILFYFLCALSFDLHIICFNNNSKQILCMHHLLRSLHQSNGSADKIQHTNGKSKTPVMQFSSLTNPKHSTQTPATITAWTYPSNQPSNTSHTLSYLTRVPTRFLTWEHSSTTTSSKWSLSSSFRGESGEAEVKVTRTTSARLRMSRVAASSRCRTSRLSCFISSRIPDRLWPRLPFSCP